MNFQSLFWPQIKEYLPNFGSNLHISSSLYFWNSQQQLSFDRHCPPLCSHLPLLVHCFRTQDSSLVHLIISELVHIGSWSAFLSFENYAHFRSHSFERVAPIRSGASNSFGALLKNASAIWSLHKCYCLFHMNICPSAYLII